MSEEIKALNTQQDKSTTNAKIGDRVEPLVESNNIVTSLISLEVNISKLVEIL